jgi:hypothetical protein
LSDLLAFEPIATPARVFADDAQDIAFLESRLKRAPN